MRITEISEQKNKKNRCNIAIDGNFYCGIESSLIIDLDLFSGKQIDEECLNKICDAETYQKCLNNAFIIISIRMNSENEIRQKLSRKYTVETINKVVERLAELSYIDDELFAREWVSSHKKSRGKRCLRQELFQKRINKDIIEMALSDYTVEEEQASAKRLVEKKKLLNQTNDDNHQKMYSLLSRKGFDYAIIKAIIDQ